jgi:hypothetical protein
VLGILKTAAVPWGITAVFGIGSAYWVLTAVYGALIGSDALVYRAGAEALVSGGDSWSTGNNGWIFAAPPLEALAFVPSTLLPAQAFAVLAATASAVGALFIVRRLELAPYWLGFPPLVFGVLLGNPAVLGMALLVAGYPLLGLVFRPQLAFVAGWRALVIFGILSLVALALRPDYVMKVAEIGQTYAAQSGPSVNFWGSPLMVPALVALGLLWRIDRVAAAWLIMPAVGPAMGWYGYAMAMPVRSAFLGIACALPIHGLGAAAITTYAVWRWASSTSWPSHRRRASAVLAKWRYHLAALVDRPGRWPAI